MSTITSVDVNGLTVNQELPQQRAGVGIVNNNMTTFRTFPHLEFFPKTHLVGLGTVQIMTGIVIVLLGIVMLFDACPTVGVSILIVYWGPLIFIVAGSLTIAAANKQISCLVKGSLGMNVISAVTAGMAIFLLMLDVFSFPRFSDCPRYPNVPSPPYRLGISGVLVVLSLLQFIISICLSAFPCTTITYCQPSDSCSQDATWDYRLQSEGLG
ncbi:membrane-spanning 4-domains subfamily A member 4A [Misgurnus anguillicaudatus]|uniref:membrane-spanning 4-domains subfamily A member 4A n=1 Tax=Misgurnus anguillicaudatus TaxID=75329 RepID=UPI003CCF59B2